MNTRNEQQLYAPVQPPFAAKNTEASFESRDLMRLKEVTKRNAQEVNRDAETNFALRGLVDAEQRIKTSLFSTNNKGIYEKGDIQKDEAKVKEIFADFASAHDPRVQQYYKDTFGITDEDQLIEHFKRTHEAKQGNLAELAVTALLHTVLKEHFIVVRSAEYDDLKNGVDNLIIDKTTGAVICAFDELLSDSDVGNNDREDKKGSKVINTALNNGSEVKYGAELKEGKLARARITNTPIFYLKLDKGILKALIADLHHAPGSISPLQKRIFSNLISSIREQKMQLDALKLQPAITRKLDQFEASLLKLEHMAHVLTTETVH